MHRNLVLINNTGIGGTERRLGRLFAKMADQGAQTTMVVNAELWRKLIAAGLLSGGEAHIWRLPEPFARLSRWIQLGDRPDFWLRKLDYIVFSCLMSVRYGLGARQMFHVALGGVYVCLPLMVLRPDHRIVISVVHDLSLMVGASWGVPAYRFALSRCRRVDALSEVIRADLIHRGIFGEKIAVSEGSVVDTERFQPLTKKEPWVVFSGRLVEEKNPLLFVEAVPHILRRIPQAKFFLIGEGPLQLAIRRTLQSMKLEDAVELGFLSDPATLLGQARVFVSLQRTENYPSQSLLEAMACGNAIVATDVGLTRKIVDETVGVLVKPDSLSVAEAVADLLGKPQETDAMGQKARARVMQHHSTRAYLGYLQEIYEGLGA